MPRIAIVGAGIAGLNAALTLQDVGLSCSIYEASNRIGGRMHSDTTTWADGMVSGWCGEFKGVRQGPVHFAGEHCSVEFQGFMEGAAREGARAAQEIAQYWGEKQML